VVVLFVVF